MSQNWICPSYDWWAKVKITRATPLKSSADLTVIMADIPGEEPEVESLPVLQTNGLPQKHAEELNSRFSALQIHRRCSPVLLEANGRRYLIVFYSAIGELVQKGSQAGLDVAKILRQVKCDVLRAPNEEWPAESFLEGLGQGFYCQPFRSRETDLLPSTLELPEQLDRKLEKRLRAVGRGLVLARSLGDSPAGFLTPKKAIELCKKYSGKAQLQVYDRKKLEDIGFHALLSVSCGSPQPPFVAEWKIVGSDPTLPPIVFVGKGVTFDSGGMCLKPGLSMPEMKYDMCGAAAVAGAMHTLSFLSPKHTIIGLAGWVENGLGSAGTRPGDVISSLSGKTIEVLNTDAEGRLILADLLTYADRLKPELIVDIATLTGAVLMALGSSGGAVLGNHANEIAAWPQMSASVGEPFCPLPIWPELSKELRSECADLKNIASSSVWAGTLVAAAFLKEFVGTSKWLHLDIAGVANSARVSGFPTSGASGFSVKSLVSRALQGDHEKN